MIFSPEDHCMILMHVYKTKGKTKKKVGTTLSCMCIVFRRVITVKRMLSRLYRGYLSETLQHLNNRTNIYL
jgi:hypothetical protein